jgi:hypothetical protein
MVAPGYVSRNLDIPKLLGARPDAAPLQRKVRKDAGVPRKLTPEVQAWIGAAPFGHARCERSEERDVADVRVRRLRGLPLDRLC